MKKFSLGLFVLGAFILVGCASTPIYAQTLPTTVTVIWNANPPTDTVTSYEVTIDSGLPIVIMATANATLSTTVPVTAFGHHVVTVTAKNVSLACDDPTQCSTITVQSSAPSPLGFTLSPAPAKITNPKISKP